MVWFGKNWFLGGAKFLATDAIFGQVRFHPLGHFSLHEIFRNQNNKDVSIQGGKKMPDLARQIGRLAFGGARAPLVATLLSRQPSTPDRQIQCQIVCLVDRHLLHQNYFLRVVHKK